MQETIATNNTSDVRPDDRDRISPPTPSAPTCATIACKRPLTYLEKSGCWRCLKCNPIKEVKPTERPKRKYMDVKMTEEMVREIIKEESGRVSAEFNIDATISEEKIREIVQDELANWHIQRPPILRDEMAEALSVGGGKTEVKQTWRQQAKELGIPLHKEPKGSGMRKKIDVLVDIAKKNEASPEGDINDSPVTAEKGA